MCRCCPEICIHSDVADDSLYYILLQLAHRQQVLSYTPHDYKAVLRHLREHVLTDHILRLTDEGDSEALSIARKAAASKAKYPLDHTITRAIKQYKAVA